MVILVEVLDCIEGHGNVYLIFAVFSFESDAAVEIASPIFGEIILGFECSDEMINVLLTFVFNAKIINNQSEGNGLHAVFPESWGMTAFEITM